MNNPHDYIDIAIDEAKKSLQEGNNGFGAVIIKENVIASKAHDTDSTTKDPTAHAEINVIRQASGHLDGNFNNCMLVSTHEPCPMCSTAIVWAGVKQIAFGYSIKDSLAQGRRRINLACSEIFKRANASIEIITDVKKEKCRLLYDNQVRKSIKQLRNVRLTELTQLADRLSVKRINWFKSQNIQSDNDDALDAAYRLFLMKLGISAGEAPIVDKQNNKLVIHSKNFCPTLEACKILGLDTRYVCKHLSEEPTQALLQQLHPNLRFKRNYDSLRPFKPYCEEMIIMIDN